MNTHQPDQDSAMHQHSQAYVISIVCRDRMGLIFEIAQAVGDLKGNIADSRQSVLSGYFSMILLASFPEEVTERAIERKFAEVDSQSETAIDVSVAKVPEGGTADPAGSENVYVLTATGDDRIGLVATVASFCTENRINILDLETTVSSGEYVMILFIDLAETDEVGRIRSDLQAYAAEHALTVVLQKYEIFQAINEINLPPF